jgi:hypothetical protein
VTAEPSLSGRKSELLASPLVCAKIKPGEPQPADLIGPTRVAQVEC